MTTPCLAKSLSTGCSTLQETHQVAHTLTKAARPNKSSRVITASASSTECVENSGKGLPIKAEGNSLGSLLIPNSAIAANNATPSSTPNTAIKRPLDMCALPFFSQVQRVFHFFGDLHAVTAIHCGQESAQTGQ